MTETRTLLLERELPYPPAKVWRALTEGALIKEWLMDNDFQPEIGHRFQFRAAPVPGWNGIIDSKILTIEPQQTLSYTWNALGLHSVVLWTLTPTLTGTIVRMEQSGFRPDQEFAYKGANYGWQNFLGKLEKLVAALE